MRTMGRRAAITLFTGSIAAGLTFGVTSVLAAPAAAGDCPFLPSEFLGMCPSGGAAACTTLCQYFDPSAIGSCPSGCCVCRPAP
ncbi:MAG TPA: hypothetical protein VFT45_22495 [Longimicrobium sp.]|nr:hypothetical protein [Longimicrobium sp.]